MEAHLSNDRFMACHRNQINPKEIPEHALTFSYGDWKYDKMARQLRGSDHIIRKKVLIEINEDFHRADYVVLSLKFPLLRELILCCKEEDDARRELASAAVMKVAAAEEGTRELIDSHYISDVTVLLRDSVGQIRANAFHTLLHVSEFRAGYEATVEHGLLPTLVELLEEEKEDRIIVLALRLLKNLCEAEKASEILLGSKVLERLNAHLDSKNLSVRCMAVANLGALSFKLAGKKAIIFSGSIPILCKLFLNEEDEALLIALTKVLASLANKKRGKVQIMELGAIPRIKDLLSSPSYEIRLNIVQIMSNIAEHPIIREDLKECLDKLREMQEKDKEIIKRFAKITIDVITWTP